MDVVTALWYSDLEEYIDIGYSWKFDPDSTKNQFVNYADHSRA